MKINYDLINGVFSNPILREGFFSKLKELDDKDRERNNNESIQELKQKITELKRQES